MAILKRRHAQIVLAPHWPFVCAPNLNNKASACRHVWCRWFATAKPAVVIVAFLMVSTAPLYAQRQQNVAKLKADAQKVVSIISGDEAKTQTYCEARDIAKQIIQAGQEKDNEKAEELADKLTEQQRNLGSEYLALMQSLRNANLTSKDGQEIESLFDELDESSCPH